MTDDAGWFSDDAATFGDRLAAAREQAGMTQAALAGKLGVKTGTIVGWENDLKEPRANKLQMVSGMLGVSLSWLLTGEGEGPQAPDDTQPIANDILTEMRALRTQIAMCAEKLGQLEKRMRASLRDNT
ncbi:helix-turn-helix transcriptional regulator [Yoonia sp.]|uniref:helix-turn-helix domain-containing protein n=1 Tax=Yoonia sp. TaxID=2212373 RepID=UPI0019FC3126|nr:helix-turn-helix transcriptional regulator [Yoonia sp.]MBE0414465.1 helix-turn-helix transcriptional regulator [Yoonia sp.]